MDLCFFQKLVLNFRKKIHVCILGAYWGKHGRHMNVIRLYLPGSDNVVDTPLTFAVNLPFENVNQASIMRLS